MSRPLLHQHQVGEWIVMDVDRASIYRRNVPEVGGGGDVFVVYVRRWRVVDVSG